MKKSNLEKYSNETLLKKKNVYLIILVVLLILAGLMFFLSLQAEGRPNPLGENVLPSNFFLIISVFSITFSSLVFKTWNSVKKEIKRRQ